MMTRIALVVTSLAFAAHGFAAEQGTATGENENPMAGWVPSKVKNEKADKKDITAVLEAFHQAGKKGDVSAAAALVDYPVLMVTDDSKGEAKAEPWDRQKWIQVMSPFYAKPMEGTKMTHRPAIFLISDSLATVGDQWTMTTGGKTVSARSSMLMVRKEGKWLVKSMVEGGWGDTMGQPPATAAQPTPPSGTGAGTAPSDERSEQRAK